MSNRELFEIAEYLAAAWRLSKGHALMSVREPNFSSALEHLANYLPNGEQLEFANTRIGRRCLDAEQIVFAMQANLLADLNLVAGTMSMTIDETVARVLLRRRGHNIQSAQDFGHMFCEAVKCEAISAS